MTIREELMETNKISVVINTYNARQHLEKVLDSVKDFDEIVVCDMESTDDTLMMIFGWYAGTPLENIRALMDAFEKYMYYWD